MKFINHGSKPTNHTPEALVAREINVTFFQNGYVLSKAQGNPPGA